MHRVLLALSSVVVLALGCGDNIRVQAGDDAALGVCGNVFLEGTEQCDDGNTEPNDGCSPTCIIECGDGQLGSAELCDPGIASGPGACPTESTCMDDDSCTIAIVSGSGCEVTCEFATITAAVDGDSCCPAGEDASTDSDCDPVCGNGVVEQPELCDTTIPIGDLGECPVACNDGQDCTSDLLLEPGTCNASCNFTPITMASDGDMCCPPGANPTTDSDCVTTCGDGAVTGIETCDTAITTGPGVCPTACNDGDVCTADTLVNAGTCRAACQTSPIPPGAIDQCCPAGADLGDDPDCPPACGDGVITAPETCEDGNTSSGDGCSATCRFEPVAFRMTDLDLRDPHTFASVPFLGCADVTNLSLLGNNGVNPTIEINITTDDDGDGLLDLSLAQTFLPQVQAAGTTTTTDLVFPDCTAPMSSTSCQLPAGATHTTATATNQGSGAVCLTTVPGTVNTSYTPAIVSPTAPAGGTCYAASAGTVTFTLSGLPITLLDARISGEWFGSPATEIRDGLIRGFLSEATADATIIPEGTTGIASIDGEPLSSLLRGGTNNCSQAAPATGDKDSFTPQGGSPMSGWYLYLSFTAARAPYTEL